MANWIMINPDTKAVTRRYVADQPDESIYLYRDPYAAHRQVPDRVRLAYAIVNNDDSITESQALVDADTAARWARVRSNRDVILAACDWTQLLESPLDDATKASWRTYRQALRDVPQHNVDPDNISWPTPPAP